jgi:hypothetical protein
MVYKVYPGHPEYWCSLEKREYTVTVTSRAISLPEKPSRSNRDYIILESNFVKTPRGQEFGV